MSATDNLDPHILSTLSDEEIAAINAPESDDEKLLKTLASDDSDEDDDANADGDAAKAPAEGKPAEKTPPAEVDPATPAADASQDDAAKPSAEPSQNIAPVFVAEAPADYEAKLAEFNTQAADLKAKFKNGDMDVDEYDAQRASIDTQKTALERQVFKAEIARDMQAQSIANQWSTEVKALFSNAAKAESGGIDYNKDDAKRADLDMFLKVLSESPANKDKPMSFFTSEAHKRVLALHGISASAAPAPASRAPNLSTMPKTLAGVPTTGAQPQDTGGDEFAHLDALNGEAFESALLKLSPDQRERYAAGA